MNIKNSKASSELENLSVKLMSCDDFEIVRGWCIREGWNLGLYDTSIYLKADPEGHFIFFLDEIPVGSMSLVKHTNQFFTIGPFIVAPEYRNMGYGSQIWERVMKRLSNYPGSSILLYAVASQVEKYKQYGFKPLYKNYRWIIKSKNYPNLEMVHPVATITENSLKAISRYDQSVFSINREAIFKEALKQPHVKGFYLEQNNQIKGLGFLRPCVYGFRIGPLFADNPQFTKSLIAYLVNEAINAEIIIEMPDDNNLGQQLMTEIGAIKTEIYTVTMVKSESSVFQMKNLHKNYGLFSLEIG